MQEIHDVTYVTAHGGGEGQQVGISEMTFSFKWWQWSDELAAKDNRTKFVDRNGESVSTEI